MEEPPKIDSVEDDDPSTFNIRIVVTDGSNPIKGANVVFGTVTRSTGSAGGANIYNITSGEYDLTVSKDGYASHTETVTVDGDETITVTLDED